MATPNLGYQNFFSTTLSSTITASDTTIYLNSLPTPSEGYLVIEPDSTTNREIIYYTSKGANFVTCPSVAAGRGVGGTSAASHSSGVTVQMNNNAELWTSLQDGSANTGMHQWFDDSFADYIKSGGTITQATGLIASVSSGVAYINGRRLTFNAFSKQVTPAKDTYFDIVAPSSTDNIATVSYVELASGVTGSVPTSNGIHLGVVNSASSSINTISQQGSDRLGYPVYVQQPVHKIQVMRQDDTTNTTKTNSVILSGWGVITPGVASTGVETVNFGVTFAQRPIVIVTGGGDHASSTSYGSGAANVKAMYAIAESITNTSFAARVRSSDGTNWGASNTVFYQWTAIGELA